MEGILNLENWRKFGTIGMLKTAIYNTNSVTEIINDYKSNKIKEIIIIENQDTTYKYKY